MCDACTNIPAADEEIELDSTLDPNAWDYDYIDPWGLMVIAEVGY